MKARRCGDVRFPDRDRDDFFLVDVFGDDFFAGFRATSLRLRRGEMDSRPPDRVYRLDIGLVFEIARDSSRRSAKATSRSMSSVIVIPLARAAIGTSE